jgi:hypothetical protein
MAENCWNNFVTAIADPDRSAVRFEEEFGNLIRRYSTNRLANI